MASAFGQHRKFPPHARKTSGTQGTQGSAIHIFLMLCNGDAGNHGDDKLMTGSYHSDNDKKDDGTGGAM